MSMGAANFAGSILGATYAQMHGAETERRTQDRAAQQRGVDSAQQAENASGIGETDGKHNNPHERDADGRRIWELPHRQPKANQPEEKTETPSRDATGEKGQRLDLSG